MCTIGVQREEGERHKTLEDHTVITDAANLLWVVYLLKISAQPQVLFAPPRPNCEGRISP